MFASNQWKVWSVACFFLLFGIGMSGCQGGGRPSPVCATAQDCAVGERCAAGRCENPASSGCRSDQDCEAGRWCANDGACLLSREIFCEKSDDCPPDADCALQDQLCSLPRQSDPPKCQSEKDCKATEVCEASSGKCIPKPAGCRSAQDCASGEICNLQTSRCEAAPSGCRSAQDCASGEICNLQTSRCEAAPSGCRSDRDCAVGERCDASTGRCNPPVDPGCKKDGDCKNGERCNPQGQCEKTTQETPCTAHSDCAESFACRMDLKVCKEIPAFVTIRLEGAMIGPTTASGEGWDDASISPETVKKIAELMTKAATTYYGLPDDFGLGAVLGEIASLLIGLSAPPDVFGTAELLLPGQTIPPLALSQKDDSYNPTWDDVKWDAVPFLKETKIRVSLADYDPLNGNDDVGSALLNFNHLVAAYWKSEVIQVNISQQTKNQILFLGVSVIRR